ncbi:CoA ester lyase [Terrabacter sp. Ter38]|uniref:HpcH/HpaI aldolase/citrate lyase family protein n=1 Tax=Terrabacter sp. Ter38 TaxID=2926030 RepID=UPI002117A232|nr:CoA ester lyase [Terrabacter sp. Ter38]
MTPATAAAAELDWERAVAWLYVPAVRPDRFTQAAAVADGVIIDLEDAVHPSRRAEARENLTRLEHEPLAAPVVVRVNPPTSRDFAADVEALTPLVRAGLVRCVRIAKVDSPEDAAFASASTAHWGLPRRLVCQLESARAVADAREIGAVPGVHSLMLGEADLRADLGLPRGPVSDSGLLLARQQVVLASRALGLPSPVASAYTNTRDEDGLRASSAALRALGFHGRSCIHPAQVDAVRQAFAPTPEELRWARETVATARERQGQGSAADTLSDGTFVDPAIVREADLLLARAPKDAFA